MHHLGITSRGLLVLIAALSVSDATQSTTSRLQGTRVAPTPTFVRSKVETSRLPLAFQPNRGQVDSQAAFVSHGRDFLVLLERDRAVVTDGNRRALTTKLAGASRAAKGVAQTPLPGRVSYFLGRDKSNWHTAVPTYARVRYTDVYPGVDLVYYGDQRRLEYDFIVAPGADPQRIALTYPDATSVDVDSAGNLTIRASGGTFQQPRPVVYQDTDGVRESIGADYVVTGPKRIGFRLGKYDRRRPLVIDPTLVYASYLGGRASTSGTPSR